MDDRGSVVDSDGEDVLGPQEPVDEVEDLVHPATRRQRVADRLNDLPLTERAHRSSQPVRAGQPPVELLSLSAPDHRRLHHPCSAQEPSQSVGVQAERFGPLRSEEHTSELQSLMRISYAGFCLKKKKK